ncbi:hypothetical protein [Streptomyces sp. NPDC002889]|uniref:hypothetical protein n=1 Tax=Streptomyces sp. NPDC002889 TaxID=3364669 RepID=UPI003691FAD5
MRLRNALALSVAAATITPVALTGPAAAATVAEGATTAATAPAARAARDAWGAAGRAPGARAAGALAVPETGRQQGRPGDRAEVRAGSRSQARPGDPLVGPSEAPEAGVPSPDPAKARAKARPVDRFADRQPTCGKAADPAFPIDTRIHGGPGVQHPGTGVQAWSVDLKNTTPEMCRHIHPVIILTGSSPGLTPDRITMEFYDEAEARWRPVVLEGTSRDELVGAFDEGFRGFVVPARRTVTVKVRLALAPGTAPNKVTVNAAVVQRRGNDGDWVGASGDYRFAVVEAKKDSLASTLDQLATTGMGTRVMMGAAAGAILLCGAGALVLMARRRVGSGRR